MENVTFYLFCYIFVGKEGKIEKIKENSMQTVEPIRKQSEIEQIKGLLKRKRERDYLLFVMGINLGLRISDLLNLKVSDVRDKSYIEVVEQKTGKNRRIPIRANLALLINKFVQNKPDDQWLFRSQKGDNNPITRIQAYRLIKNVCRKAGFVEHIGTHTLRKTFGYHLYQTTKDVALLQNIFNHSSPAITMRYIGINQDIIDLQLQNFML